MAFDVVGAKKAGYSDQEIQAYIGNKKKQPSNGFEDYLPTALGTVGGVAGHLIGVPVGDVETASPAGSMALGAGLSGVGGGIGELIRQGVKTSKGEGFDLGAVPKSMGEQAAYGAIPGGQELKAAPVIGKLAGSLAGRTAIRGVGGYIGGNVATQIRNIGNPSPEDANANGLSSGVLNSIIPGLGEGVKRGGGAIGGFLTKTVPEGVFTELNTRAKKVSQVPIDRLAALFGNKVVDTTTDQPIINPAVKPLLDKFGLTDESSIQKIGNKLSEAGTKIENELKPILDKPYYAVDKEDVDHLINTTLDDTVGSAGFLNQTRSEIRDYLGRQIDKVSAEANYGGKKARNYGTGDAGTPKYRVYNDNGGSQTPGQIADQFAGKTPLPLGALLKLKRFVGEKADWENTPVGQDPFQQLYIKMNELMKSKLDGEDLVKYGQSMDDHHNLIEMKGTFDKRMKSLGQLPDVIKNPELVKGAIENEPINNPALETLSALLGGSIGAGVGAGLGGIGMAGGAVGGGYAGRSVAKSFLKNPKEARNLANVLTKINEAGSSDISQKSQQGVGELLRQLGIRMPSPF